MRKNKLRRGKIIKKDETIENKTGIKNICMQNFA